MSAASSPASPSPSVESPATRASRQRLGGFLLGMGVLHVIVPKPFEAIVPRQLGHAKFWNLVAAAAEAGSGALLLSRDPAMRRAGGVLATATVVAVYPANIQMAVDAGRPRSPATVAPWLRLPLQFPMIAWAWRHARGPAAA